MRRLTSLSYDEAMTKLQALREARLQFTLEPLKHRHLLHDAAAMAARDVTFQQMECEERHLEMQARWAWKDKEMDALRSLISSLKEIPTHEDHSAANPIQRGYGAALHV